MIRFIAAAMVVATALPASAQEYLQIELKSGMVTIELFEDVAPNHVARVKALTEAGAYDGVAFHRVIDRFMAQTGDVEYGRVAADGSVSPRAGFGGSDMPDLKQEFSDIPFARGTVGAARGGHSVDSANSQFFIMFDREPYGHNLDRQYTVWGCVAEGIEHVDNIEMGEPPAKPDQMIRVTVTDQAPTSGSCR
jgi:cyclophilin family peptidyl-prolyl cis-trans isomerase